MKEPNYQTAALKIEYFQSFGSPKVVRIHKFFPRHFLDLAEEPNSHSEVRDQSLQVQSDRRHKNGPQLIEKWYTHGRRQLESELRPFCSPPQPQFL